MRPTSSTRSSLMEMSLVARQEGTETRKTPRLRLGDAEFQPLQNAGALRRPRWRGPVCAPASRAADRWAAGGGISRFSSATPPTMRMPGEISCSSSMARARPRTVLAGSCAFSKRMEASVRSLMADEVLRMVDAWKLALSSTTRVVLALMALSHAADHAGQRDGAARHRRSPGSMARACTSRRSARGKRSPALAGRTKMVSP